MTDTAHPNDDAVDVAPVIREPWITDPGQYDLTDEQYHADPVIGGSLSSSGARQLLATCPARFDYDRQHPPAPRKVFDFGHAAHCVVLGVGAPIASLPYKDRRTNAYKAAEKRARDNGETPLLEKDADRVFAMAEALAGHPIAGPLLRRPGRAEQSYVARDPDTGIMCRARVDWQPDVPTGGRLIVADYKSAASAHPRAFAAAVADHGYHQQGPFYEDVLQWLGLVGDAGAEFVLIAQEKEPPYLVAVYRLTQHALDVGIERNRRARELYRWCTDTGTWPGYPDREPIELDLPRWADEGLDLAALVDADPIGAAA